MTSTDRRERMRQLLLAVQTTENEAHAIGLHVAGHALNAAKNAIGWEIAGNIPKAAEAARGERDE